MRILIADSQSKVRRALAVLLKQQEGLQIAGEASDAEELMAQVEKLRPDLVLFHWRLNGANVEDLLPALRAVSPGLRVLALSARPESSQEALACGADAFVCKIDQPERLLSTIQNIQNDADCVAVQDQSSKVDSLVAMEPLTRKKRKAIVVQKATTVSIVSG